MVDICIPEMMDNDGLSEWRVILWMYANGANVVEGDVICEVMAEKVAVEIPAPASGRLTITQEADAVVKTGECIGTIET
jgi:pyruvate dehydrogenase E2 component (dihydrolipoamide acetyltransferase)